MSRDPQINVRIPQRLKDAMQVLAEKNKRSVNSELIAAIEFWTGEGDKTKSFIDEITQRINALEEKASKPR